MRVQTWSIARKITTLVVVLLLLLGGSAGYTLTALNTVAGHLHEVVHQDIPLTGRVTVATVHQLEQDVAF